MSFASLKNWKTASAGIVAIVNVVLPMVGINIDPAITSAITGAAAGAGLLAAKDANRGSNLKETELPKDQQHPDTIVSERDKAEAKRKELLRDK